MYACVCADLVDLGLKVALEDHWHERDDGKGGQHRDRAPAERVARAGHLVQRLARLDRDERGRRNAEEGAERERVERNADDRRD